MRTTVRIDDDLLNAVRERAERSGESITRVLNSLLRQGITAEREAKRTQDAKPFVQRTVDLGEPLINVDKALSIADAGMTKRR